LGKYGDIYELIDLEIQDWMPDDTEIRNVSLSNPSCDLDKAHHLLDYPIKMLWRNLHCCLYEDLCDRYRNRNK